MNQRLTVKISLGDLIFAFTEEIRRHIKDEHLVTQVVADLLAGMKTAHGKISFSETKDSARFS